MSTISNAQKSTQGNSSREVLLVETLVTTVHKYQCNKHSITLTSLALITKHTITNTLKDRLSSQKEGKR